MIELIYGRNPVLESMRAGRRDVRRLMIAQGVKEQGVVKDVLALARRQKVQVSRVDRRQLDKLGRRINHQGIAAEVSDYPYAGPEEMIALAERQQQPLCLLFLDCLQDPQNLGTLLRTAEVVGVHGIVIPERRAVGVTPAVVSASSGACEHLLIAQVTNLSRAMVYFQERDVWFIGLEDVEGAGELWQADLTGGLGIVVGSEGQGMRRLVRETCDILVRLPMWGQINSLNAAVAGSIALYEAARQRSAKAT